MIFEDIFTPSLKTYFHNVCRHIYTCLEDFIIPCLTTCLHHVWRLVNTSSETCLINENIMYNCLHIYVFHRAFTLFMMMCLSNVSGIFALRLKTCSYNVYTHVYTKLILLKLLIKNVWKWFLSEQMDKKIHYDVDSIMTNVYTI